MENKDTSKKPVKMEFLPLLLCCIDQDGNNISKVAKTLGKTKQALNYHLSKQKKAGLIRTIQKQPYSIYVLTDLGKRVKKILIQSEGGTPILWRCHALIVGYNIISYGTYQFVETINKKIIQMANWKYAREQMGEYVINIQDTGLLKIYCPERYAQAPEEEFGRMYADAERIAQHYCNRYDMALEKMKVIRVGHKELQNSNKVAELFGKTKTKDFWVDNSTGTDNLEEHQGSDIIESLLQLPDLMKQIIVNQHQFSENLVKHLDVMQDMKSTLKEIRDVMGEFKDEFRKRL